MQQRPHIIERAFQLAEQCGSLDQVRRQLISEGYLHVESHLQGAQIRRDIKSRLHPELRSIAKAQKLAQRKPSTE